jgi:hypothetical protein
MGCRQIIAAISVLSLFQAVLGAVNSTPEALNPQLTDNIPHKGPIYYYNGKYLNELHDLQSNSS